MRGATLIVLAWNQWPLTRRCLDSLLASELDFAEVLVVDNGSEDDTPSGLAGYAGRVRVLRLPENLGFVRGMNAGIAAARTGDDVVLLNNDLLFTQADWLGRLRDAAYADPATGIVGCRLLGPEADGRVYHVGGYIEPDDLHGEQNESGQVEREVGQYPRTRRVQAVAFALAYLRRDALARLGGLDEAFHSYFEDTDCCLRAADLGIASVIAGAVTLRHDQHGSTESDGGFRARLFAQSRAAFAARWRERLREDYRGDVLWHGATRSSGAPAQLARLLVRRLDARGLRMGYAASTRELGDLQDGRLDLAARRRLPALPDAALACGIDAFAQARGRWRVGLGFSEWETAPARAAQAARALDLLLVPDAFQRDAFARAGVRTPIERLPLGVDRDYCHPDVAAPRHPRGDFVFLAVAEDLARDAPEVLVETFRATFRADEPVQLLLQIAPGRDALAIRAALDSLPAHATHGRVRLLDGWGFPWHQRAQLLSSADAYVSARRGGGWDPRAAETIACGRLLLATDFGSQAALAREHGLAVAARLVDAGDGRRWAEPDRAALAACLRDAVDRRAALLAVARARADAFAREHDIDTGADRLVELLARGGTLAPARTAPTPHRPSRVAEAASGQIVVLGMHRSGTSSVAGLLARLGVHAGDDAELMIGPDNPKGHYELARLHGACLRRLEAAGGDWKQPPTSAPGAAVDAFRRDIAELLRTLEPRRPWLIKEPRLCLLARELLPLLTRPVFVHVVRDPHAVAQSLAARNGLARDHALALWRQYTQAAFEASRGWPRVLVDYAEVLADPLALARRLYDTLRGFGIEGLRAPDAEELRAWIDPAMAHARPSTESALDDETQALWDAIRDGRVLDPDVAFDVATAPLRRAGGR
ncbi:glycosyltransferase [Dokdonella sp.]|uniref:glycosyltransferase n=1 Tax=Dokdonella sp. TaxID=2291710 RepID=UPI001B2E30B3|nr:glycosyltransferase [Dokdonella sp.]MBO9661412.1 glycosyltransferase [Dokdonella sp.]